MALPLKRKVETGLSAYLQSLAASALADYAFAHGSSSLPSARPRVVLMVDGLEDAFPGAMPKHCSLVVFILTDMDNGQPVAPANVAAQDAARAASESAHEAAMQAIESGLQDLDAMQAYLNKANETDRPVSGFYLYDVLEQGQSTMFEDRCYGNGLRYRVTCEAQDN